MNATFQIMPTGSRDAHTNSGGAMTPHPHSIEILEIHLDVYQLYSLVAVVLIFTPEGWAAYHGG